MVFDLYNTLMIIVFGILIAGLAIMLAFMESKVGQLENTVKRLEGLIDGMSRRM